MTQISSLIEDYTLIEKYVTLDVDSETGNLIGITEAGEVFLLKQTNEKQVYKMEEISDDVRSIFIFPETESNVIGIIHQLKKKPEVVMDVIDIRYGVQERQSLPLPPLPSGIRFSSASGEVKMLISSNRGICAQSYSVNPVSLASMMTRVADTDEVPVCEQMEVESAEGSVLRRLEGLFTSGTKTETIISGLMEVNSTRGSFVTETVLSKILCHLLEKDCFLEEKSSVHLMHIILTTVKFNPTMLTKELKACIKTSSMENSVSKIFSMSSALLDSATEDDEKTVTAMELIICLIDSHLMIILGTGDSQANPVGQSLIRLQEKVEKVSCYFKSASQVRSFLGTIVSTRKTSSEKRKFKEIEISCPKVPVPGYSVETIHI
jgi:hypothetical protein